jgi:hypothetical protein
MVSLPQSWRRPLPWIFLSLGAAALVIQLNPAWRDPLLYERLPLARGEIWRAWTGHFVHFGWPHFIADTGLFLLLGWLLQARHPRFSALALALLPVFISAVLYWFDPAMTRYGGLSALNLGLLLYLAAPGLAAQLGGLVLAGGAPDLCWRNHLRAHARRTWRRPDSFRRLNHPSGHQRASGQRRLCPARLAGRCVVGKKKTGARRLRPVTTICGRRPENPPQSAYFTEQP